MKNIFIDILNAIIGFAVVVTIFVLLRIFTNELIAELTLTGIVFLLIIYGVAMYTKDNN